MMRWGLLLMAFLLLAPAPSAWAQDTCRIRDGSACVTTATEVRPQTSGGASLGDVTYPWLNTYTKHLYATVDFFPQTMCLDATNQDTCLVRDAAAALALRNGTTAQSFYVYKTYTSGSTYERGRVAWAGNNFTIGTQAAGTGTLRSLYLDANTIVIDINGSDAWIFQGGNLDVVPANDLLSAIGDATHRVSAGYFGLVKGVVTADCSAPAFTFITDTNTGLTSSSADTVSPCVGGFAPVTFSRSGSTSIMSFRNGTDQGLISTAAAASLNFGVNDATNWYLAGATGHFTPNAVNTYDLGDATNTIRAGYFGTSLKTPLVTLGASTALSSTAPARASGFGTNADASFATGSTAVAWDLNIGTGGAPTSGVLTMPAAAHGWMCQVHDATTISNNTYQSAYTTTSVTLTTTVAWSANDHLYGTCIGF